METYRSRVYTDRPAYADLDAPAKFQAVQGIIATRLRQHPKAICSYSGGADSDILIDLIERTRQMFGADYLPSVKYVFFDTGLEMKATKDHVREVAEKYGVEIETVRPKKNIVRATREHGIPFVSKIMSGGFLKCVFLLKNTASMFKFLQVVTVEILSTTLVRDDLQEQKKKLESTLESIRKEINIIFRLLTDENNPSIIEYSLLHRQWEIKSYTSLLFCARGEVGKS